MNLLNIISKIEEVDPEATERYSFYSRRNLLKVGSNLAAAAVPTFFAATANKAFAQAPSAKAVEVLKYALLLEYLEDEFYRLGLAAANLVPTADRTVIGQIGKHETAHVALLRGALGTAADPKPTFKFPAGTFTDYAAFLGLAQALEDTGVRAYKGQAGELIGDKGILEVALQIHSVEARHASQIRRMRGMKGWVTTSDTGAFYAGEAVTSQGGVELTTLAGVTGKSAAAIAEAFDEPLTMAQVLAIANTFL